MFTTPTDREHRIPPGQRTVGHSSRRDRDNDGPLPCWSDGPHNNDQPRIVTRDTTRPVRARTTSAHHDTPTIGPARTPAGRTARAGLLFRHRRPRRRGTISR